MSSISVTSSYAGDALKQYILAAILGGETLSTAGISVLTNIPYKRVIKKLGVGSILQAGSCDFSPTSGATITEAVLEPQPFKINEEICFLDIENTWDDNSTNIAGDLQTALTNAYVGAMSASVETLVWQSNTETTGTTTMDLFDGFEKILTGGTAQSGVTLTVANIVTEINKVYAKLPAAVAKKPKADLVLFMSHKAYNLYEMALAAQGINTTAANGNYANIYGIEIKAVGGLSDDNIMAMGEKANFYVGTNLNSDFNEIKIIDMRQTTGDDSVRFILKGKLDVAIAYPAEVVFYKK